MTYGLKRVEILSAQANGVTLLVLALLILVRGRAPPDRPAGRRGRRSCWSWQSWAIVVNLAATLDALAGEPPQPQRRGLLPAHPDRSLRVHRHRDRGRSSCSETGGSPAIRLASLLVAALMLRAAYGLLRDSGRIFLEAAPSDLDPDEIGRTLVAQPCVSEVHDLHVWEISSGFPALTAHVLVSPDCDCHATRRRLAEVLRGALRDRSHDAPGRPRAAAAGAADRHPPSDAEALNASSSISSPIRASPKGAGHGRPVR